MGATQLVCSAANARRAEKAQSRPQDFAARRRRRYLFSVSDAAGRLCRKLGRTMPPPTKFATTGDLELDASKIHRRSPSPPAAGGEGRGEERDCKSKYFFPNH